MIVPGSASQSLSAALAAETGLPLAGASYERFPDGEGLVTVEGDLEGERTVVVAATPTDAAHVELLQLQDAVREAGADEVVTVLPYMGYARQDASFEAGQPISARAVARAISTAADRVLVVNPHKRWVCDFFDVPAEPVDAAPRLAEPLPADLDDPLFLAPDENALSLAETVRDAYGAGETDYFEKHRLSGTEVEIAPSDAAAAGRDVVAVDDIVATGSTMSEAIAVLRDRDAARVFVACVHPVLAGSARTKLANAGVAGIYGTDTLERAESAVTAAPTIAERL
ncbi:MAG TPA: ribose-phosphate diphosphokinase [Halobacteriales archaeon]|nr:ribose-phosphate diphosphokinase [Halobacteriales archaeon]